jgi:hypothetical protein
VYDPLPSQLRFHDSEARFKTLCGPVGTGKSLALCQEAVSLAFTNPGRLGLIGRKHPVNPTGPDRGGGA